ncbi:protein DEHYDRATION-INDUCED 19 homolog 6-like [Malania oleifera]|uniref:protein DEHYDRATION-INDUCED 19 homolog 6-like n=1 Tax=Malania oleifera TaxID=397392 RepID=UPI0025AE313E|nr:protein DEHYDRATION-INDUCED 19 homolog 6-like [Malania oleifera]
MDLDFWASRVHSAKHFAAVQAARLHSDNHLILDDSEGDDDARACFPCPFCCVDIELAVLCSHLQEEHCFDFRNAVCPICAANLGKDVMGHFREQHAHSLKRRRKAHRSSLWMNNPATLGKELRELSSFLGSTTTNSRGIPHDSAPDPLLSPFLCNIPLLDLEVNQQDKYSMKGFSTTSDVKSSEPSIMNEGNEQDYKERIQRAAFCQELVFSIIF